MFKYGFVVLNYMNYCDAIECVSSLLAIKRNDYKIIIVDNYSQNESIIELQHYFCGNEKVKTYFENKLIDPAWSNDKGTLEKALQQKIPLKYDPKRSR